MKICPQCNKELINKRPTAKFCSRHCKSNYWNKIVYRRHEWVREKKKAYFKKWYKENKEKHNKKGTEYYHKNKHLWGVRGYANQHLKEKVFKKYNSKCVKCKSMEKLEMHHITYDIEEGKKTKHSSDQIILLCLTCHKLGHREKLRQI